MVLDRNNLPVSLLRPGRTAHHHGDVGPIEIGIHQADLGARQGQRAGEVCGNSRFADAALPTADRDDMFDARDQVFFGLGRLLFVSHTRLLIARNHTRVGQELNRVSIGSTTPYYFIIRDTEAERKWAHWPWQDRSRVYSDKTVESRRRRLVANPSMERQ